MINSQNSKDKESYHGKQRWYLLMWYHKDRYLLWKWQVVTQADEYVCKIQNNMFVDIIYSARITF